MKLALATLLAVSAGSAMAADTTVQDKQTFAALNGTAPVVLSEESMAATHGKALTITSSYNGSSWTVDNAGVNGSITLGSSTARGAVVDISR